MHWLHLHKSLGGCEVDSTPSQVGGGPYCGSSGVRVGRVQPDALNNLWHLTVVIILKKELAVNPLRS